MVDPCFSRQMLYPLGNTISVGNSTVEGIHANNPLEKNLKLISIRIQYTD